MFGSAQTGIGGGSLPNASRPKKYQPPHSMAKIEFNELLAYCGRSAGPKQASLFPQSATGEMEVFYAGDLSLLRKKCVSVIGARSVTEGGARRTRKVAAMLATEGVVVTSGLAKGVDQAAHSGAIDNGGSTVAVIGTPLDKVYPAENARLQEQIYQHHLLVSQFPAGTRTFPSDFPKRNRLMATLTDASIIVEASDTSGTLHQAAECIRLDRWLFIMQSVAEDQALEWPRKFLNQPKVAVLRSIADVLDRIS